MSESKKKKKRVTMKDVARHAGVSQTTVSFVLNNRDDMAVAEATRARVLAAADELKFRPNQAARSLRAEHSFTIGIVTKRIVTHPYAGNIMIGIQNMAQDAGYLCNVIEISDAVDGGQAAVTNLLSMGVAGLIFVAPGPEPLAQSLDIPDDLPRVYVNCWPHGTEVNEHGIPNAHLVFADEFQGGRDAASAALALGHRAMAFLGGPADEYACIERERGLDAACAHAGLPLDDAPRFYGNYNIATGYDVALEALKTTPRPTALICGNDRMAVGALIAIHELGLRCPGDVSLVGFDDQPDIAGEVHPRFSTVALPHLAMGEMAARALLHPESVSPFTKVACTYISRESLAPLALTDGLPDASGR